MKKVADLSLGSPCQGARRIPFLSISLYIYGYSIDTIQFKKLLTPGKIGQILCLGNLTDRDTFELLRGVAPDLQLVKGDFDVDSPNLPLSKVVTHGSLRIGFTHGHTIIPSGDADALLIAARQMDVDILLWGGTHRFEAFEMEGRFFVNPGSATGAMSTGYWPEGEDPTPSFCLMDVSFAGYLNVARILILYRSKAMCLCFMSISSRRMPTEPKLLRSRRCLSVKTPFPLHELCLCCSRSIVYIPDVCLCLFDSSVEFSPVILDL